MGGPKVVIKRGAYVCGYDVMDLRNHIAHDGRPSAPGGGVTSWN